MNMINFDGRFFIFLSRHLVMSSKGTHNSVVAIETTNRNDKDNAKRGKGKTCWKEREETCVWAWRC